MKILLTVLLALNLVTAEASNFSRKAVITCDFSKFINWEGKLVGLSKRQTGKLIYSIDLDSKCVKVSCAERQSSVGCFLDGESAFHELTTQVPKHINFNSDAMMPTLNIEGSDGDSNDMFIRIGSISNISAIAVLNYADEGVDGIVSQPTTCMVQIQH